jgi:hypothetical protein
MTGLPKRRPARVALPRTGVLRLHADPAALPAARGGGPNRFDDPRPRSLSTFRVRYGASSLRGCLLESLDWLRPDPAAASREADVVDHAEQEITAADTWTPWVALEDFLADRQVGTLVAHGLHILSIDDPHLQAQLDQEPGVRALLDSLDGRAVLSASGRRPRLDQAAVRLSSEFGRELSQACSLAVWDRIPQPDGLHYRSRHDDGEDCWALYDHARVSVQDVVPFLPSNPEHRAALHDVAGLWDLALPPIWQ